MADLTVNYTNELTQSAVKVAKTVIKPAIPYETTWEIGKALIAPAVPYKTTAKIAQTLVKPAVPYETTAKIAKKLWNGIKSMFGFAKEHPKATAMALSPALLGVEAQRKAATTVAEFAKEHPKATAMTLCPSLLAVEAGKKAIENDTVRNLIKTTAITAIAGPFGSGLLLASSKN